MCGTDLGKRWVMNGDFSHDFALAARLRELCFNVGDRIFRGNVHQIVKWT